MFFCAAKTEDWFVQNSDLRIVLGTILAFVFLFSIFGVCIVDIVSFVVGIILVVLCVVPLIHGEEFIVLDSYEDFVVSR